MQGEKIKAKGWDGKKFKSEGKYKEEPEKRRKKREVHFTE